MYCFFYFVGVYFDLRMMMVNNLMSEFQRLLWKAKPLNITHRVTQTNRMSTMSAVWCCIRCLMYFSSNIYKVLINMVWANIQGRERIIIIFLKQLSGQLATTTYKFCLFFCASYRYMLVPRSNALTFEARLDEGNDKCTNVRVAIVDSLLIGTGHLRTIMLI